MTNKDGFSIEDTIAFVNTPRASLVNSLHVSKGRLFILLSSGLTLALYDKNKIVGPHSQSDWTFKGIVRGGSIVRIDVEPVTDSIVQADVVTTKGVLEVFFDTSAFGRSEPFPGQVEDPDDDLLPEIVMEVFPS